MHASVMEGFRVLSHLMGKLLSSLDSLANKRWVRQVPAAAVIPAPQVMTSFIGFKVFVAGLISS